MPLVRLLILTAVITLVVLAVRRLLRPRSRTRDAAGDAGERRRIEGRMVQCHFCGLYVPEQEAIRGDEHAYCSAEHRDRDGTA